MIEDHIRHADLRARVTSPEAAAKLIQNGMVVGMSGFTRAGEALAVPMALAERARSEPLKITLVTGASLGNDIDKTLSDAAVTARRIPFQSDPGLRRAINDGSVMFIDQHLSETVEQMRRGQIARPDIAVIEAVAITPEGGIIPTTSVGNSASFAILARQVIVEINTAHILELEGLHDIYIPSYYPNRLPIPVLNVSSRIGTPAIMIDPDKIAAIVLTHKLDSPSTVTPPDDDTRAIAGHLVEFFGKEVAAGRMDNSLAPLQAGIGAIANAVMHGLIDSPFENLTMYSEVLQDSTFDLMDAGKMVFASGSSITLSAGCAARVYQNFERYKSKLVLRPQEISNHPEVVRRLGLIAINTALEFDIYGNVNSTHVAGTHMMNGIGGSGDFARNAMLSVFVTKSFAKGGAISSVVPMVSHVDHTEHDVDILVTEQGLADLRGLAPRERARIVIANCAHPDQRDALSDYFERAAAKGGQTPHILEEAVSWHTRLRDTGRMIPVSEAGDLPRP